MLAVVARSFGMAVVLFLCATVSGTTLTPGPRIGTETEMTDNSARLLGIVKGYTSHDCSGTAYFDAGSGVVVCQMSGVRSFAGWGGHGGCSLCP